MTRRFLVTATASATAAVLLLAGCVPAEPGDDAGSTTPDEAVVTVPFPVLDLDCADLVTDDDLAAFLAEEAAPAEYQTALLRVVGGIPEEYPLAQVGATSCYWKSPTADFTFGGPDGYPDVRVLVRPDAEEAYTAFLERYYTETIPDPVICLDFARSCSFEGLVGSDWVTLLVEGIAPDLIATAPAAATDLVERLSAAVEEADRREPWTVPADALVVPSDCEAIASVADLTAATGVTAPTGPLDVTPGPGRADVDGVDPLVRCWLIADLLGGDLSERVVTLRGLTGGAWAWADAATHAREGEERERVEIDGLAEGDEAWLHCDDDYPTCQLALVLGGSWIEIDVNRTPEFTAGPAFEQETRDAILAVGAVVVANLTAD